MQVRLTRAFMLWFLVFPIVTSTAAASIDKSDRERLAKSATVLVSFREGDIPAGVWNKAACVAVIPDMKKIAFVLGGQHGKGVMSCRVGNTWSAPAFIELTKGSFGFQAGVQEIDLVLLVMNRRGAERLLDNGVELGVDASVAAGPVGAGASAGTDVSFRAEILAYSRAKGIFAGIDLSGGGLGSDKDANRDAYGTTSAKNVVFGGNVPVPAEATAFVRALGSHPRATTGTRVPAPQR